MLKKQGRKQEGGLFIEAITLQQTKNRETSRNPVGRMGRRVGVHIRGGTFLIDGRPLLLWLGSVIVPEGDARLM